MLEKHWEMLRWVVSFMEENAAKWSEMKQERERDRRKRDKEEEWSLKSRAEKLIELQEEEELVRAEKRSNKEERYKLERMEGRGRKRGRALWPRKWEAGRRPELLPDLCHGAVCVSAGFSRQEARTAETWREDRAAEKAEGCSRCKGSRE